MCRKSDKLGFGVRDHVSVRVSRVYKEIGHDGCQDGLALICPQQVVRVVLVEIGERHDKRTNGQTDKKACMGEISRVI